MFVTSDPVWSETVQISGQDIQTYITINTSSKYCEKERKHLFRFSFNSFSFFAFTFSFQISIAIYPIFAKYPPVLLYIITLVSRLMILISLVSNPSSSSTLESRRLLFYTIRNLKIVLIKLKLFINPK